MIQLLVVGSLAAGLVGTLAASAGAQTGDTAAACAARLEGNQAETKAENLAVIDKVIAVAPAAIVQPLNDLKALVTKKGNRGFESDEGFAALTKIDAYFYDNCAGVQVPVTAIDYEFQGVPATLPSGMAKIKLANNAPKEDHEMAMFKLQPGVASVDLAKLFKLSDKKAAKFVDFDTGVFAYAPAGQTSYAIGTLAPGQYVYACFLNQGGKDNGKPHFLLGMEGTLTVS
jgi:hypothetical protein